MRRETSTSSGEEGRRVRYWYGRLPVPVSYHTGTVGYQEILVNYWRCSKRCLGACRQGSSSSGDLGQLKCNGISYQ